MLKKDQFALDKEAWCNLNQPDCSEEDVDIVILGFPMIKESATEVVQPKVPTV